MTPSGVGTSVAEGVGVGDAGPGCTVAAGDGNGDSGDRLSFATVAPWLVVAATLPTVGVDVGAAVFESWAVTCAVAGKAVYAAGVRLPGAAQPAARKIRAIAASRREPDERHRPHRARCMLDSHPLGKPSIDRLLKQSRI
jgi:hypothetical protein